MNRRSLFPAPGAKSLALVVAAALGAVVGASPAAAGDPKARAAQSLDCTAVEPAITTQAAPWSDRAGWDADSQYPTIQLADIDGDGRDELLGRSGAGMVANRFDPATGMWVPLGSTQNLFSDADLWNQPRYYETIQFADVNGSPGAELIARSGAGLLTYAWDPAQDAWLEATDTVEQLGDAVMGEPGGWATIQLADIDGDKYAEVVDRVPGAGGGMEVFTWGQPLGRYRRGWSSTGTQPLNRDADQWDDPSHYLTLRYGDVDGKPGAEMVGRGTEGIETHTWDGQAKKWVGLRSSASPIMRSWDTPDKFSTIQLGDINGDGRSDLVGRGSEGIEAYWWNNDVKDWVAFTGSFGLSDDNGWQDPSLWWTLQLADVMGDDRAELIGRGHNGAFVTGWTDAGWTPLGQIKVPSMADAGGWQFPESYATIQAGNVTGDGKAEIIGRSSAGIETWTWDKKRDQFVSTVQPGFPTFTGDAATAYQWIGQNTIDEKQTDDIRSEYDNDTYTSAMWTGAVKSLHTIGATPPDGLDVTSQVWSAVAGQLAKEFSYVDAVRNWHDSIDDFLNQTFASNALTVETVGRGMDIPSDARDDVVFDAMGLVLDLGSALESLAGPWGEAAAVVTDIVHVTMEATQLNTGKPPDIQAQVFELENDLQDWNERTHDGNTCVRMGTLASWPLLKALGERIVTNELTWPGELTTAMVHIGHRKYEIGLWKTLSPVKWTNVASLTGDTMGPCRFNLGAPGARSSYPTTPAGSPLFYTQPDWPNWYATSPFALFIVDGDCRKAPSEAALRRIFLPTDPDGIGGGLGVPINWAYCGWNGWHVPGSDAIQDHCRNTGSSAGATASAASARPARIAIGTRGNRKAQARIAALSATVRADRPRRAGRILANLRAARQLLVRAEGFRGTYFVNLAHRPLRAAADQARSRRLARRVHSIRELLVGRRGDPPRVGIARAAANVDGAAGSLRLRCPIAATGPCAGQVELLQRGRAIGRRSFALAAGRAVTLRVPLARAARDGAATVRATTTHVSGNRTVATRRITLAGAPARPVPGACASRAC